MRVGMSIAPLAPMYWEMDGISHYTAGLIQSIENLSADCKIMPYYTIRPDQILQFTFNRNLKQRIQVQFPNYRLCPFLPSVILPKKFSKGIDIYHTTDYLQPRFNDNTVVISTIYDAFIFNNLYGMEGTQLRRLKNKLLKKSIKHIDHIITLSKAMVADIVNDWGAKEKNITVIYPGISRTWFQPSDEIQKKRVLNKYNLRRNYLLFVGTIQPRKNLERIIDAFRRLPLELQRLHPLIIVGQKGWEFKTILSKMKELEFKQVGKWLNYVPFYDIKVLYQCSSLVLCPSLGEGFGFSIIQGFACKTPVITSTVTAMPEIAQDAALLVDPYSIDEIHQAILSILTNQSLHQYYVAKGWQRAHTFSWKNCAKQMLEVYKKFI